MLGMSMQDTPPLFYFHELLYLFLYCNRWCTINWYAIKNVSFKIMSFFLWSLILCMFALRSWYCIAFIIERHDVSTKRFFEVHKELSKTLCHTVDKLWCHFTRTAHMGHEETVGLWDTSIWLKITRLLSFSLTMCLTKTLHVDSRWHNM